MPACSGPVASLRLLSTGRPRRQFRARVRWPSATSAPAAAAQLERRVNEPASDSNLKPEPTASEGVRGPPSPLCPGTRTGPPSESPLCQCDRDPAPPTLPMLVLVCQWPFRLNMARRSELSVGKLATARAVCYKNSGDACRSIGTATGMLGPSDPSSVATCPLSILEYRRLPQADATTVLVGSTSSNLPLI